MAMNLGRTNGDVVADINTTPLIDIMLVLLTLLIITLPLQTHAIKIDLPTASTPPPVVVTLGVDFEGGLTLDGRSASRAEVDSFFVRAAQSDPQPVVRIEADKLTRYGLVADVLADAQRTGVRKIGINSN